MWPFKNKQEITKRLYTFNNKVIPQIYNKECKKWCGINRAGQICISLDHQVNYCSMNTAQEAVEFLESIGNIIPVRENY